jgi:hypothetical protein
MGDRVSIRFINGSDRYAPVIFCHWGGTDFVEAAINYAKDLIDEIAMGGLSRGYEPLDRLEPRTVTCDFLYNIDKYWSVINTTHRITHDIYLGINEDDGDNGDNGHFNIDLNNPKSFAILWANIKNRYSNDDNDDPDTFAPMTISKHEE